MFVKENKNLAFRNQKISKPSESFAFKSPLNSFNLPKLILGCGFINRNIKVNLKLISTSAQISECSAPAHYYFSKELIEGVRICL